MAEAIEPLKRAIVHVDWRNFCPVDPLTYKPGGTRAPRDVDQTPTTREVPTFLQTCTPTGERMTKWFTEARGHHSSHPTLQPVQYDTGKQQKYIKKGCL